jgi:hypothetical protein
MMLKMLNKMLVLIALRFYDTKVKKYSENNLNFGYLKICINFASH